MFCFRSFGAVSKHKLFHIKQPLAANFYSLPIVAESFNTPFLHFISLTFAVIFSYSTKKAESGNGDCTLLLFEVLETHSVNKYNNHVHIWQGCFSLYSYRVEIFQVSKSTKNKS
jgi:hypothetical protein